MIRRAHGPIMVRLERTQCAHRALVIARHVVARSSDAKLMSCSGIYVQLQQAVNVCASGGPLAMLVAQQAEYMYCTTRYKKAERAN